MSAESIDSYRETLFVVLDEIKPSTVIEYGTGISTGLLALSKVTRLRSIEHDENYYDLAIDKCLPKTEIVYQPDLEKYPLEHGGNTYDFAFVDGRCRAACLREVKDCKAVMLHDAARAEYREAIESYKHRIWTDEGNTVTLTNNSDVISRLAKVLSPLACIEPQLEFINSMAGDKL